VQSIVVNLCIIEPEIDHFHEAYIDRSLLELPAHEPFIKRDKGYIYIKPCSNQQSRAIGGYTAVSGIWHALHTSYPQVLQRAPQVP
jgi:hypothetical protein